LVRFPILDPEAREIGVVQVAPALEPADRGVDRGRGVALLAEAIADLAFRAWTAGQEAQRRRRRLADLVGDQQRLDPRHVELVVGGEPLARRQLRPEPERERAVEENVDPLRIALLRRDGRDPAARRQMPGRLLAPRRRPSAPSHLGPPRSKLTVVV
jgi:hypothetical protein